MLLLSKDDTMHVVEALKADPTLLAITQKGMGDTLFTDAYRDPNLLSFLRVCGLASPRVRPSAVEYATRKLRKVYETVEKTGAHMSAESMDRLFTSLPPSVAHKLASLPSDRALLTAVAKRMPPSMQSMADAMHLNVQFSGKPGDDEPLRTAATA